MNFLKKTAYIFDNAAVDYYMDKDKELVTKPIH
jgi:hypothetical protein